jgi:hypothetical protein
MEKIKKDISLLVDKLIINKILLIRGLRVMIDNDLAELFEVPTKRLNEQVKRNLKRFPIHFMFVLTKEEKEEVVAKCDHLNNLKYSPYLPKVFTEYGVLQLANVLNSDRAILMGNRIIEIFVKMRELLATHKEIIQKLEKLEENDINQNKKIELIFEYLRQFEQAKQEELKYKKRKSIGFKTNLDKLNDT